LLEEAVFSPESMLNRGALRKTGVYAKKDIANYSREILL
jgi:hypothetical protein